MKNKGFTLMELLAVIVILAIIALIATPIILGIIKDANKNAFKESINGIINGIKLNATMQVIDDEIEYKYENNKWEDKEIEIDGSMPKYVEVKVNKEGNIRYAINDGEYCAIKEYDSTEIIKSIGDKNTEKQIKKEYCKLDAVMSTDESCFEIKTNNENIKITGYSDSCPKNVIIPEEIDGKKVTGIGVQAFAQNQLTSVTIPNSVTSIEDSAFSHNYLTSVIIPSSVNFMGAAVFSDNKLTSIIIPSSVTSINKSAFSDNELTNITIPNSVTRIADSAFENNLLKSLIIPSSVTYIGGAAFTNNQLSDSEAFIYNRNKDGSIDYSTLNSYGGANRNNVVIPNSVTSIGFGAFRNNEIESIQIPDGVTSIGKMAFSDNKLTNLIIPDGVISIGEYAFEYNKLTNVIIKGKTSLSEFENYPTSSPFGWNSYCNDTKCITFESK